MVRVGGGWVALDEFLVKNDPCRGKIFALIYVHVLLVTFPYVIGHNNSKKNVVARFIRIKGKFVLN